MGCGVRLRVTERGKAEEGGATESSKTTKLTKPKAAKVIKPAGDSYPMKRKLIKETLDDPLPAKRSKAGLVGKRRKAKSPLRFIDEPSDKGVPVEEPAHDDEEANIQRALELSLKEQGKRTQGLARPVEREQAAHDLLTLQTLMKKSPTKQFIFQRRPPMPTESSAHASMDAELNQIDNEGQAGPNPGIAAESQLQSSHVVHAEPNLEHVDLGTSDASTQQKPEQIDEDSTGTLSSLQNLEKDLSFTDQFFVEKPQEEEPGKTNAETEVQSMVSVPIHQDTSSVPSMTTSVIDLTKLQSNSSLPTSTATISTITTTTTNPLPPPPQPQQSIADPILVKRIGKLEQHMADLIQNNLALEEMLDKQGSQLYNLENLNIPHKVSQAVDEIVTDAVHWAMQAPLRARFRDLPTKSLELDYSNQRLADQEETSKKRRKRRDVPRTPHGSPSSQPPPPPPPAGASGALGTLGASGSSQFPPPPPLPSTGAFGSAQQQGNKAPSLSKTTASASQSMAWTTSDTRNESAGVFGTYELSPTDYLMQDDSNPEEQILLFDDEDSKNDHQPKADVRKDWWKPLPEEERPATPEPA
ncbi:retrovirus-related pol polyprotein from transposon TNT 1-94 [Tanacetum coccineum]|uniref:Retrovirus-related pol polyprotein from transposon TNT 1-94 n=1 Tax=Tanacetum coccineum TaxID=301880 RepID=A0ABQ5BPB0_9ASTR